MTKFKPFSISKAQLKELEVRSINTIRDFIVHCSDSDYDYHDDISVIDEWHKERGWTCVGYHYFIKKNGEFQRGRPVGTIGAHCKGHNHNSVGICLSGKTDFNTIQYRALRGVFKRLLISFNMFGTRRSNFYIFHHRDYNPNKTCPNFDLDKDANIYIPGYKSTSTDYLSNSYP